MAQRASTAAGRRRASARATAASQPARKPSPKAPAAKRAPAAKKQSARSAKPASRPRAQAKRRAPSAGQEGGRGIVAALQARSRRREAARAARPASSTTAAKPAKSARRRARPSLPATRPAPLRALARLMPAAWGARVAVLVLIVAVLGSAYHFWLRDSPLLAIDDVEVEGLSGPDGPAIAATLTKSAEGMTTLNADPDALLESVADFPVVRAVEIDTGLPTSATITVTETPPAMIARVDGESDSDVPVAADGTLLPGASTEGLDLPVMSLTKPPEGDELADAALEQALVVGAAPKPLRPMIETVGYSTGDGVSIGLEPGVELEFGASDRAHAKWSSAASVMADPNLTQLASIDLRVPDRPAVG